VFDGPAEPETGAAQEQCMTEQSKSSANAPPAKAALSTRLAVLLLIILSSAFTYALLGSFFGRKH
jgi:hypothetical protein